MSLILKRGNLPTTPHTEFYAIPKVLSLEEVHGTYGFSGAFSRKLHVRSYPTEQIRPPVKGSYDLATKAAAVDTLQPYHILTGNMPYGEDALAGRKPIVFGQNTILSISKPTKSTPEDSFFRNGEKHEAYFVQEGTGTLKTEYGNIPIRKGLYLLIPKGTTYQIELTSKNAYFLVMESSYPITFPPHYLNQEGQAKMMAPVVETEIEPPEFQPPRDEKGEFLIDIKHAGRKITRLTLGHHPFDLAGWEGALYPFGFDVKNHHGIAREIHTAPPLHQTFQSGNVPYNGFSICSFVSQMEGWHPKDIPAPYAHYNVDSDEVMFFSNTHYGARKGVIQEGSFTFHPGALPHSPQGRAALKSLATRGKVSNRLAIMLDTMFEPLSITDHGYKYRDKEYALSWHKATLSTNGKEATEALHGT
ncbi:MAG: homogentisate 1,2-dioxygenase [Elusimicrobia bacterium]|nr:homogentisate 1,2-dioxygenase [Elusimicrobiota bacterium]